MIALGCVGKANVNVLYQGYNFNGSLGRINLLRTFDPDAVQEPKTSEPKWHYGGFVDVGYLLDFNHPANDIFRSRGTAWHVDDLHLNMAGAYVKKDPSETSRWGAQLAVQGGKDSEVFGFSATAPNIDGFKWLRHLGPTNVPVRWTLNKRWSASVRPEVFWDRDGRWTLARQTVKAITTTLEYRIPYKETNTILRLEHRWDDSRGPDGGFFRGAEVAPGMIGLTPTQHLLIFGLIFTFDHYVSIAIASPTMLWWKSITEREQRTRAVNVEKSSSSDEPAGSGPF